jgi:hypothetical protein
MHMASGRKVLREVLAAPIVFTPTDDRNQFGGK